MQEKNMGHICPIGRSGVKDKSFAKMCNSIFFCNVVIFIYCKLHPITIWIFKGGCRPSLEILKDDSLHRVPLLQHHCF